MKLNEALNLVLPVGALRAYHTPISREVFEANYRVLAATKAQLSSKGIYYQMDAGPRIACLTLQDEGRKDAEDRGDVDDKGNPRDALTPALLEEIKRLTVILCPSDKGFDLMPVDAAIGAHRLDPEDWAEALSAIVFFTCLCCLSPRASRQDIAKATAGLLKGSTTSLSPMEAATSLPSSTRSEPPKAAASAVPS